MEPSDPLRATAEFERASIWSVGGKWLSLCLVVIFILTACWITFVSFNVKEEGLAPTILVVVEKSASGVPLIVALVVAGAEAIGGLRLITHYHLEKLKEKLRQEGRDRGREEGLEEGREKERRAWDAWNKRREEAANDNRSFDEPPPSKQ